MATAEFCRLCISRCMHYIAEVFSAATPKNLRPLRPPFILILFTQWSECCSDQTGQIILSKWPLASVSACIKRRTQCSVNCIWQLPYKANKSWPMGGKLQAPVSVNRRPDPVAMLGDRHAPLFSHTPFLPASKKVGGAACLENMKSVRFFCPTVSASRGQAA